MNGAKTNPTTALIWKLFYHFINTHMKLPIDQYLRYWFFYCYLISVRHNMTFTQSLTDLCYFTVLIPFDQWQTGKFHILLGLYFFSLWGFLISSKGSCAGLLPSSWDCPAVYPLLDMVMPKCYDRYHTVLI